jgi:hypothetical protein
VDNLPDLADVAAAMAIAHYTIKAARWAVTKYGKSRAMQRKPVLLSGTIQGKSTVEGTLTVEKALDTRWNAETLTLSLARRLEELVSWYLHVS